METIERLATYVLDRNWWKNAEVQCWPPYLFALTALIMKKSGCYIRVLRDWPPNGSGSRWHEEVKRLATEWREAAEDYLSSEKKEPVALPAEVRGLMEQLGCSKKHIQEINEDDALSAQLIRMMAIADEASAGLGLPLKGQGKANRFQICAKQYLFKHTLTPRIPTTVASVLPKQHTPTGGLSLRSMSHHLALHVGSDAYAKWHQVPQARGSQLNIVVAPWPLKVRPAQFKPGDPKNYQFAPGFACFDLEVTKKNAELTQWVSNLLTDAYEMCGQVDAVVFPEASLTPSQFDNVCSVVREQNQDAFVVAGVLTPATADESPKNQVWIKAGIFDSKYTQDKHHRWRLDRRQVEMYGLGGRLDPGIEWWEHIGVQSRAVNFLALDTDLTMCCLVCEDLARQEPVGELVRAIGPNLVIALLADGPQLAQRWPARYATVLADDPGTSVLTVTSLGMAQLAKPPPGKSRSRSVALWKDALGDVEEISLPTGSTGAILCLRSRSRPEWAADGRDDTGVASCPQLVGIHYLKSAVQE
jgi:hypothetical protein